MAARRTHIMVASYRLRSSSLDLIRRTLDFWSLDWIWIWVLFSLLFGLVWVGVFTSGVYLRMPKDIQACGTKS